MILVPSEGGQVEAGVRLNHQLSDRPPAAKTGAAVQQAEPRVLAAVGSGERVAEDLQPGADGEDGRALLNGSMQGPAGAELAGRQNLGRSSPPPSTYRSQESGTCSPAVMATTSASYPRQRSRSERMIALPESPYVPSRSGYTRAIRTAETSAITGQTRDGLEGGVVGNDIHLVGSG